eukprot:3435444-Rhodomonas_salina.3
MSLLCARLQVLKLGARTQLTVRAVEGQRLIGPWAIPPALLFPPPRQKRTTTCPPHGNSKKFSGCRLLSNQRRPLLFFVIRKRGKFAALLVLSVVQQSFFALTLLFVTPQKPKKAFRSPYHLYYAHTSSQWARESKDGKLWWPAQKKGMMQQIANE